MDLKRYIHSQRPATRNLTPCTCPALGPQLQMFQELSRCWPAAFASELTVPAGLLVAHSGVAQMALQAFQELRPYLLEEPEEVHIAFAGHSLGGALGQLLLCLAKLELGRCAEGAGVLVPEVALGTGPLGRVCSSGV